MFANHTKTANEKISNLSIIFKERITSMPDDINNKKIIAYAKNIIKNCGYDAGIVNPAMAEKRFVFSCEIGMDQRLGEISIFQLHAPFPGVAMKGLPVDIAHHRRQRRFIFDKRLCIRKIARKQRPKQQKQ